MLRNNSLKVIAILCVLGVFVPAAVNAQTAQPRAHINDVRGPEPVQSAAGLPGLSLELDFSLLDADEQVMAGAEVESATVDLANGNSYPAQVQKAETPWSVVILIDISKTLTSFTGKAAHKAARFAIADSLEQAPRGTNFAVLTFGTLPKTVLEFSRETDKIGDTIRKRIAPDVSNNSCLNDGVYEAVTKLSGASGRRAALIFTASADNCGQRLAQDVIDLAQANHIEIFTVGLKGYSITEEALDAFAEPTGGLASLREQDDLVFAFQNVMRDLSLQWQAKATIYPPAGKQTVQLSVMLKDKTKLTSEPVTIESNQDFAQPPEISIKGQVLSTHKGLRFNLKIVSPDLINQLNISVVSKKTGDPVVTQNITTIAEANEVAADNLKAAEEYTLVVVAVDRQGQTLSQASADFKYEPAQSELKITEIQRPTVEQPEFVIQVEGNNLEGAVKYKAWLVAEGNDEPISGTTQTAAVGETLRIPASGLATGKYQVVVQALDGENTTIAQVSGSISYQRPSWLETALGTVGKSPLAIVAITLVCGVAFAVLAVVGVWLVLPKRSAKPKPVELVLPEKVRRQPRPITEPLTPVRTPQKEAGPGLEPEPPPRRAMPPRPERKPALPKACLSGQSPEDLRFSTEIVKSPFTIGRRESNDLVLKVDNASGVSGSHAIITFASGRFYIEDDKSTYGTTVNDQRTQPGTPTLLEDEAMIGLGPKVRIRFQLKNCP